MSSSVPRVRRPFLHVLFEDFAPVPSFALIAVSAVVAIILRDARVLASSLLILGAVDTIVVGTFLLGARPIDRLEQTSLLMQLVMQCVHSIRGALGMLAGGFLGAVIGVYVGASTAVSGTSDWMTSLFPQVIGFAVAVGALGAISTLARAVLPMRYKARSKSLRRGVRRVARVLELPSLGPMRTELLVRHLTSNWYLLWLPLIVFPAGSLYLRFSIQ